MYMISSSALSPIWRALAKISNKSSKHAYDGAINKLTEGNGSLTKTADKIKSLGAKANKQIDQKYLEEE